MIEIFVAKWKHLQFVYILFIGHFRLKKGNVMILLHSNAVKCYFRYLLNKILAKRLSMHSLSLDKGNEPTLAFNNPLRTKTTYLGRSRDEEL